MLEILKKICGTDAQKNNDKLTMDEKREILKKNAGDIQYLKYLKEGNCKELGRLFNVIDINRGDLNGKTRLHKEALKGNTQGVKTLIELGGDPSITDLDGNDALSEAISSGCRESMHYMLLVLPINDTRADHYSFKYTRAFDYYPGIMNNLLDSVKSSTPDKKNSFFDLAMSKGDDLMVCIAIKQSGGDKVRELNAASRFYESCPEVFNEKYKKTLLKDQVSEHTANKFDNISHFNNYLILKGNQDRQNIKATKACLKHYESAFDKGDKYHFDINECKDNRYKTNEELANMALKVKSEAAKYALENGVDFLEIQCMGIIDDGTDLCNYHQ